MDTHIFIDSLNSIYLIHNHIHHPTSQHHHPDKLLIATIVRQIFWTPCIVYIHKVPAHSSINGNEIVDTLANERTFIDKPTTIPHIHIACTTPIG